MFSNGQIIFAVVFIIVFTVALFYSYRGDGQLHAKNYKGVKWIAISFLLFIGILFLIKQLLK